jgi:hypothetical protein
MRTPAVVVHDPRAQDPAKVTFVERDQPIQTFSPDCPDQPLAERIGLRRSYGVFSTRSPIERIARSTTGA